MVLLDKRYKRNSSAWSCEWQLSGTLLTSWRHAHDIKTYGTHLGILFWCYGLLYRRLFITEYHNITYCSLVFVPLSPEDNLANVPEISPLCLALKCLQGYKMRCSLNYWNTILVKEHFGSTCVCGSYSENFATSSDVFPSWPDTVPQVGASYEMLNSVLMTHYHACSYMHAKSTPRRADPMSMLFAYFYWGGEVHTNNTRLAVTRAESTYRTSHNAVPYYFILHLHRTRLFCASPESGEALMCLLLKKRRVIY